MEKQLIYAVDDEESIRELYSAALLNAGYECSAFVGAEDLFSALKFRRPALILLDIMLDGTDGYEILSKIKENAQYSSIPVIMVSAKGEEISKVKGLNMGADDYISKPFGVLELIARIKANLRKSAPSALSYADIFINELKHEVTVGGAVVPLTVKEYGLLKILLVNAPNVVTRDKILDAVWGEDYFGESRTLDIHVATLRKAVAASAAKIITVRGVGFLLK